MRWWLPDQASDSAAREQLEKRGGGARVRALRQTFQDCIAWARLKFQVWLCLLDAPVLCCMSGPACPSKRLQQRLVRAPCPVEHVAARLLSRQEV